jgi:hypothetical protein
MTGFKQNLANYQDKKFKAKVELGDDGTYDIKGFGSTSFRFQLLPSLYTLANVS